MDNVFRIIVAFLLVVIGGVLIRLFWTEEGFLSKVTAVIIMAAVVIALFSLLCL